MALASQPGSRPESERLGRGSGDVPRRVLQSFRLGDPQRKGSVGAYHEVSPGGGSPAGGARLPVRRAPGGALAGGALPRPAASGGGGKAAGSAGASSLRPPGPPVRAPRAPLSPAPALRARVPTCRRPPLTDRPLEHAPAVPPPPARAASATQAAPSGRFGSRQPAAPAQSGGLPRNPARLSPNAGARPGYLASGAHRTDRQSLAARRLVHTYGSPGAPNGGLVNAGTKSGLRAPTLRSQPSG